MDEKQRQQAKDDMEMARDPLTQKRWDQEDEHARSLIHAELASMGGDLLSTYGQKTLPGGYPPNDMTTQTALAALGGFLLQRFGDGEPETHGGELSDG